MSWCSKTEPRPHEDRAAHEEAAHRERGGSADCACGDRRTQVGGLLRRAHLRGRCRSLIAPSRSLQRNLRPDGRENRARRDLSTSRPWRRLLAWIAQMTPVESRAPKMNAKMSTCSRLMPEKPAFVTPMPSAPITARVHSGGLRGGMGSAQAASASAEQLYSCSTMHCRSSATTIWPAYTSRTAWALASSVSRSTPEKALAAGSSARGTMT